MKEKRFQGIVDTVNHAGIVSFSDLCDKFSVSAVTMRRDLKELEDLGLIKRIRGGAKALQPNESLELPYAVRTSINVEEKQRIGKYALETIQPNNVVILDSSSTVRELAKLLVHTKFELTVITNDVEIARLLTVNPTIELIMVGGRIRIGHYGAVGMFAESFWRQVQADKLFLGVDAINAEHGLFNHNLDEIESKRLMLRRSKYRVVLADHEKFFSNSVIQICPIEDVDLIVTGSELSDEALNQFSMRNKIVRV